MYSDGVVAHRQTPWDACFRALETLNPQSLLFKAKLGLLAVESKAVPAYRFCVE